MPKSDKIGRLKKKLQQKQVLLCTVNYDIKHCLMFSFRVFDIRPIEYKVLTHDVLIEYYNIAGGVIHQKRLL